MKIFSALLLTILFLPHAAFACTQVAKLYGQTVCEEDLARDHLSLAQKVRDIAFEEKFGPDATKPTPEELEKVKQKSLEACVKEYDPSKGKEEKTTTPEEHAKMCEDRAGSDHDPVMAAFKNWKYNKLLFEHYGGRVAPLPNTMEPHDAYRAFIADIRGEGKLTILDDKYPDPFEGLEEYLNADHIYLEPQNELVIKHFADF